MAAEAGEQLPSVVNVKAEVGEEDCVVLDPIWLLLWLVNPIVMAELGAGLVSIGKEDSGEVDSGGVVGGGGKIEVDKSGLWPKIVDEVSKEKEVDSWPVDVIVFGLIDAARPAEDGREPEALPVEVGLQLRARPVKFSAMSLEFE